MWDCENIAGWSVDPRPIAAWPWARHEILHGWNSKRGGSLKQFMHILAAHSMLSILAVGVSYCQLTSSSLGAPSSGLESWLSSMCGRPRQVQDSKTVAFSTFVSTKHTTYRSWMDIAQNDKKFNGRQWPHRKEVLDCAVCTFLSYLCPTRAASGHAGFTSQCIAPNPVVQCQGGFRGILLSIRIAACTELSQVQFCQSLCTVHDPVSSTGVFGYQDFQRGFFGVSVTVYIGLPCGSVWLNKGMTSISCIKFGRSMVECAWFAPRGHHCDFSCSQNLIGTWVLYLELLTITPVFKRKNITVIFTKEMQPRRTLTTDGGLNAQM